MKVTVCKEVKYKPTGITSMSSNKDILVVFRKNKTLEMIQNTTFKPFVYLELDFLVVQSTFISGDTCLMLGEDGSLRMLNILDLSITDLGLEYSVGCFIGGEDSPLYCHTKNGLIVAVDLRKAPYKSRVVQKISRPVNCMLFKDSLVLGDSKGRITSLCASEGLLNEMDVSDGPINRIIHIEADRFVALTGIGELIYFDLKLGTILQKIQVRDSSLTCGLLVQGNLHFSGKDSRIICYKMTKGVFQKSYQMDKHALEIRSMCQIGETIFTGGMDGIIGIFVPGDYRYLGLRTFDRSASGRFHKIGPDHTFVLVNNLDYAEIYKLGEAERNLNRLESSFNTSVKLDKKYLEDLAVKTVKSSNEARIYYGSKVFSYDTDGKILVYADRDSTRLVELSPKIQQDQYFKFPSSKFVCVTPQAIVLQTTDLKIRIIDRKDYAKAEEFVYENLDEEIKVLEGLIVLKKSKRIYSLSHSKMVDTVLETLEGDIIDVLKIGDSLAILTKKDIMRYSLYKILGNEIVGCINFSTYDILTGLLEHNQDIFYTTQSSITNSKNGATFDLGSVIYSAGSLGTSLVVLKDDWSYLKNEIGESVAKPKYKSR